MPESSLPVLFILGKGEVARCLARLAATAGYAVEACEPGAGEHHWPEGVAINEVVYTESSWALRPGTHAIIARGHEGDAQSVAALLNHGAQHVYLIASARRAQGVIADASQQLTDKTSLSRLSAPAGLDLGGNTSMEIALSILAEIQLRHHGKSGRVLSDLREERAELNKPGRDDRDCPGKRG
jgi:xanthine dehydrogenase accessory factor